jgi:P27 family predicted phage terminase small subunit
MAVPKPRKADKPGVPACPRHLNAVARKEWRRVVPELQAAGVLKRIDAAVLAGYCVAWADWVKACEVIEAEGHTTTTSNGNVVQSPWVGIRNTSAKIMHRFAVEFGLTPSSRARVDADKPDDDEVQLPE